VVILPQSGGDPRALLKLPGIDAGTGMPRYTAVPGPRHDPDVPALTRPPASEQIELGCTPIRTIAQLSHRTILW